MKGEGKLLKVTYEDLVLENGSQDCLEAGGDVVVVVWHSCWTEWRVGRGKRKSVLVAMGTVAGDQMEVGW
jgi:hypothetical protein